MGEYLEHPVPRSLFASTYTSLGNGSIVIPEDECFCMAWLKSKGSDIEMKIANALQWSAFAFSILILLYYAYATWKTTCGWEEIYVCCVETTKVIIEFFHEFDEPAMLLLANGNRVQWLRYAEWLLTCPVILIHLSNLTGLKDDYNKRTMRLLVSDIGTIVWGATSAMSQGYVKVIFFLLGCLYGANTFFHAAKVYIESYHTVPKGRCRLVVRVMAWLFFLSWGMFPVLFLLGPEGFNHLSVYGSTIGHTIIDLMSKNCWGLLGHYLRLKIHEHILLHGDIRKMTKVRVAGQEMEVETLVTAEDTDTIKKSTAQYAHRESFLMMRDRLKEKGYEVRASLDNSAVEAATMAANGGGGGGGVAAIITNAKSGLELNGMTGGGMGMSGGKGFGGGGVTAGADAGGDLLAAGPIAPGRVILAVPDISMVDFFREQFAQLPVPYEVVPSLGADNTVQLVQQAAGLGGCDFVLMHPEFLRDKSQAGLPARLRAMGQRIAAFGWAPLGPMRDLIEESGLDGWLEGPSFGSGISLPHLSALISRMQQARKLSAMGMAPGVGAGAAGAAGPGMAGASLNRAGSAMSLGMGGGPMVGTPGSMVPSNMNSIGNMNSISNMNGGMPNGMMNGANGLVNGAANGVMNGGINGATPSTSMNGILMNSAGNGVAGSVLHSQTHLSGSLPGPMMVNGGAGLMGSGTAGGMVATGGGVAASASSVRFGTNPLFNTAPSPFSSQPGDAPVNPVAPSLTPAAGPGAGAGGLGGVAGSGMSEAEMLQQLMNEINRLKSELGEQH